MDPSVDIVESEEEGGGSNGYDQSEGTSGGQSGEYVHGCGIIADAVLDQVAGYSRQLPLDNVSSRKGRTFNVYNVIGNTGVKITHTRNDGKQTASSTLSNIIDQSKLRLLNDFNSKLFTKTSTIKLCEQKLLLRGMVTITGRSGEGKTTASLYLLKALSEKESYQPLILTDPSQWDHIQTHQQSRKPSKYIVLTDDIFGRTSIVENLQTRWEQKFPMMMPLVDAGIVLLIMTFRTNIFFLCKDHLAQDKLFHHCPVVQLSMETNEEERRAILDSHIKVFGKGKRLSEQEAIKIIRSKQVLGFPQCCFLFATNTEIYSKGSHFFTRPLNYLVQALESMSKEDSLSYLVLILVLFYDGRLPQSVLNQFERSEKDKNILDDLIQVSVTGKQSSIPTLADLLLKAHSLCGSYLNWEVDQETLSFLHQSISDAILLQFCKSNLSKGVQISSVQALLEYFRTDASPDDDWIVVIPAKKFGTLAERFTVELLSNDNFEVLTHPAFRDAKFRKYLLRSYWDDKVKECLVKHETSTHTAHGTLYFSTDTLAVLADNNYIFETNQTMIDPRRIVAFESRSFLILSVLRDADQLAVSLLSTAKNVLSTDDFAKVMDRLLACSFYKGNTHLVSQLMEEGANISTECFLAVCLSPKCDTALFDIAFGAVEAWQFEIHVLQDVLHFCIEHRRFHYFEKLAKLIAKNLPAGTTVLHQACIQILIMFHNATPRWFQMGDDDKSKKIKIRDAVFMLHDLGANCSSDECVLLASGCDDVSALEAVLRCGGNIKCKTKSKQTPLHLAALHGSVDTLQFLINKVKTSEDINGLTPFHFAAQAFSHSFQKLEFLSVFAAGLSAKTKKGESALILAIKVGNLEAVEFLLRSPSYQNRGTEYPIHAAVAELLTSSNGKWTGDTSNLFMKNKFKLVDLLLFYGYSLKDKDRSKTTPFHLVVEAGDVSLLDYFWEKEDSTDILPSLLHHSIAHPRFEMFKHLFHKSTCLIDENGNTPLHTAVCNLAKNDETNLSGNKKDNGVEEHSGNLILEYLLEQGADVNKANKTGNTPLHEVAKYNKPEIADVLIQKGAFVNIHNNVDDTPLFIASFLGHDNLVKLLVDKGADVNAHCQSGNTALHAATVFDRFNLVRYLIRVGADINITNDKSESCMMSAAQNWCNMDENLEPASRQVQEGRVKLASFLFDKGIGSEFSERNGEKFLHGAAENGLTDVVKFLVQKGVKIDNTDNRKRIPLHKAAKNGHVEIVKSLVENGAVYEATDNNQIRPLHCAAGGGHVEVVKYLVEKGANFEAADDVKESWPHRVEKGEHVEGVKYLVKYPSNINAKVESTDVFHRRPLHCAANGGHADVIRYLVEKGADFEATDGHKRTPIHIVAGNGHADIVRYLVEKGANFKVVDIMEASPLHSAAEGGHVEIVEYLVGKEADFDVMDRYKRRPLHIAATQGHVKVVKFLVEKGADFEATGQRMKRPLHFAAEGGHVEVVKYFVGEGANFEAMDSNMRRPLHVAAEKGHVEVVGFLVEKGANMEATDVTKVRPLHSAARGGHVEVVRYLVEKGADFEAFDNQKNRPLHSAAWKGHLDVIRYLVEKGANFEAVDRYQKTPKHIASEIGSHQVVNYLDEEVTANAKT